MSLSYHFPLWVVAEQEGNQLVICQRDAMLARYLPSSCLSVCLSVRSSTKTVKPGFTPTTAYDSPGTLIFCCQRSGWNSNGVTPTTNRGGVGSNWRFSTNKWSLHLHLFWRYDWCPAKFKWFAWSDHAPYRDDLSFINLRTKFEVSISAHYVYEDMKRHTKCGKFGNRKLESLGYRMPLLAWTQV